MMQPVTPAAPNYGLRKWWLALSILALSLTAARAQDQGPETFSVYFRSGISALSPAAQKTLDSLVYRGVIQPGQRLVITGWADEPGTTTLNNSLSQRRAQTVADFLTRDGFIQKRDIATITGRGYAAEAGRGNNPRYRRASITASAGQPSLPRSEAPTATAPQRAAVVPRLDTMKANSTLTLDDVLFENNSDVVLPSSWSQLEGLLGAMRENRTVRIRLEGHVCCGEGGERGRYISTIRAKAVYDFLVRNGIDKGRLAYLGFGFQHPRVFPELSEEDQWRNRRVEARIVSK